MAGLQSDEFSAGSESAKHFECNHLFVLPGRCFIMTLMRIDFKN